MPTTDPEQQRLAAEVVRETRRLQAGRTQGDR
jgi:hypothetical protein